MSSLPDRKDEKKNPIAFHRKLQKVSSPVLGTFEK